MYICSKLYYTYICFNIYPYLLLLFMALFACQFIPLRGQYSYCVSLFLCRFFCPFSGLFLVSPFTLTNKSDFDITFSYLLVKLLQMISVYAFLIMILLCHFCLISRVVTVLDFQRRGPRF